MPLPVFYIMRYYQCAPHLLRRSDNRIMQSSGAASPGRGETGGEDIFGEKTFFAPSRPPPGEAVFIGYYPKQKAFLTGLHFCSRSILGEVYRSNCERWKKVLLATFAAPRAGFPPFCDQREQKASVVVGGFLADNNTTCPKTYRRKDTRFLMPGRRSQLCFGTTKTLAAHPPRGGFGGV
jgi:hypothetical protein